MPLDRAYEKALADLSKIDPSLVTAKSGCKFENGNISIPFFNRKFIISVPGMKVTELGNMISPPKIIQLVLFHYLITAEGTKIADEWIGYRHLPSTGLFSKRFQNMALIPLVKTYGRDLEGFRRAALSLGGIPMGRIGDASYRFMALPHIPMACILYLGDEEVESSVSILFDASAPHYLPIEDLTFLGSYLSSFMCQKSPH